MVDTQHVFVDDLMKEWTNDGGIKDTEKQAVAVKQFMEGSCVFSLQHHVITSHTFRKSLNKNILHSNSYQVP